MSISPWTKESAIAELNALIEKIEELSAKRRFAADHTRWAMRTLTFLEEVFGQDSRYYLSFAAIKWGEIGTSFIGGPADPEGAFNPQAAVERLRQKMYIRHLDGAKGILLAAVDELKRSDLISVYKGKDTAPESSAILKVINLAERKLRKVIRDEPSNEKEVQDALETLLIGADLPYSREADTIEYSSKTYKPDFTMAKIDLAIEIKFCRKEKREKEIIAEINDDILAYQTKFGNLMFIIYDLGHIRDVDRFIDAFEKNENVIVRVVKH